MPGFSTSGIRGGRPGSMSAGGSSFSASNMVSIGVGAPGAAQAAKQIGTVGKRTHALSGRLVGMAVAATGAYTAFSKLSAWIKGTSVKFREFQVRMAEVSTILSDVGMHLLPSLTAGVEQLAIRFGQATSDMAKGLYDILSAAFNAEDAIGLLNNAVKASIAGLSTVRESVDILTTILNSYGMAAGEASRISDILFQSVIRGKFQFQELASALQYVVPIAAQAGIKFEELMAALSTATRHGLRLDMTSRGLALVIQNIVNPTESAKESAREYGIEMNALALRVLGLQGWFAELNAKTKEFGKTIIPDLIQNMRSLRVAMVLAGDEGLEGFATDLQLVEGAVGATNTAMEKMMNTAQFAMNVLTQQMEYLERQIGETWNEFDIWWKKSQVWWGTLLSGGDADAALSKLEEHLRLIEGGASAAFQTITVDNADIAKVTEYINNSIRAGEIGEDLWKKTEERKALLAMEPEYKDIYGLNLVGRSATEFQSEEWKEWAKTVSDLNITLDELNTETATLEETQVALRPHFEAITGAVSEYDNELAKLEDDLLLLQRDFKRLKDELEKPIQFGFQGKTIEEAFGADYAGTLGFKLKTLEAEKDLAGVQYDIKYGLEGVNQGWATNNKRLHEAITNMRDYNDLQKENSLEIMKLQLRGMRRRRGLTRNEQQRMKMLRISSLESRIAAEDEMNIIDKTLAKRQEEVSRLKYTYDQQLFDLQQFIDDEKIALNTREEWWDITMNNIGKIVQAKMDLITSIMLSPRAVAAFKLAGYDMSKIMGEVQDFLDKINAMTYTSSSGGAGTISTARTPSYWRRRKMYEGWGFQRGTHYVPRTGPAIVHKGEKIVPAGSPRGVGGGGRMNATININISEIRNYTDIEDLGSQIALAVKNNILSTDTSKYGMR